MTDAPGTTVQVWVASEDAADRIVSVLGHLGYDVRRVADPSDRIREAMLRIERALQLALNGKE